MDQHAQAILAIGTFFSLWYPEMLLMVIGLGVIALITYTE